MTTLNAESFGARSPHAAKISKDIATYNGVLKAARDQWDDWSVQLGSWFGGTDGKAVRGAIETNAKRAEQWKARGAALSAGRPLDLDDGDRVKLDTIELWVSMGNTLLKELQAAAQLRSEVGLDNAVADTTKKTVTTIGEGAADLAQTANEVGSTLFSWRKPLLWLLILGGGAIVAVNVGGLAFLLKLKQGIRKLAR